MIPARPPPMSKIRLGAAAGATTSRTGPTTCSADSIANVEDKAPLLNATRMLIPLGNPGPARYRPPPSFDRVPISAPEEVTTPLSVTVELVLLASTRRRSRRES